MDLASEIALNLSRALVALLVAWWFVSSSIALAGMALYMARTDAVNSAHKATRKVYEQVDKTSPLWLVIPVLVLVGGLCVAMLVIGVWGIKEAAIGFGFTAVAGGAALTWALGNKWYRDALRAEVDGKIERFRSVYLDVPLRLFNFGFHLIPWTAFGIFLVGIILEDPFGTESIVQIAIIVTLACFAVYLGVISGLDMASSLVRAEVTARGDGSVQLGLYTLGLRFWSRTWSTSGVSGVEIAAYIYDPGFKTWELNALVARSELRLRMKSGRRISLGFLEMPDDFTPARWVHPKILASAQSLASTLGVAPETFYLSARMFPWPRFRALQDPSGRRPDRDTVKDRRDEVVELISDLKQQARLSKDEREALLDLERELVELDAQSSSGAPSP